VVDFAGQLRELNKKKGNDLSVQLPLHTPAQTRKEPNKPAIPVYPFASNVPPKLVNAKVGPVFSAVLRNTGYWAPPVNKLAIFLNACTGELSSLANGLSSLVHFLAPTKADAGSETPTDAKVCEQIDLVRVCMHMYVYIMYKHIYIIYIYMYNMCIQNA
jgi:hypothetical protein